MSLTKEIHFPIVRAVYNKPVTRTWIKKTGRFFTYTRYYEIMEDYILYVPILDAYIFIPKGFIYDNASVPKLFNNLYRSDGLLLLGSPPHDFLYRYQCLIFVQEDGSLEFKDFTKKEADRIFNSLCAWESELTKASKVATFTLTCVGFFAWKKSRKENRQLLLDFPQLDLKRMV